MYEPGTTKKKYSNHGFATAFRQQFISINAIGRRWIWLKMFSIIRFNVFAQIYGIKMMCVRLSNKHYSNSEVRIIICCKIYVNLFVHLICNLLHNYKQTFDKVVVERPK